MAAKEIERLERMPPASPEYQMIRTYFDWVLDVPWSTTTEDRLDPVAARQVLDQDHYDLDKVKERIVEYLAVQKLKSRQSGSTRIKGPILCFVGPPGVGKTSLGQSIARAMNRKFVRISLGGVRDEAEIRGHRRTYIGAIPGRIVQALKQAGAMNPVFMLDEIDKITAGGFQGDPAAALLEVLDPAQNHSFRDHYLEINIDLSRVLFIATANQLGTIHPALLDRMEIISLAGYTRRREGAHRAAVPDSAAARGARPHRRISVAIEDDAVRRMIAQYTREAGVRNLERQIGAVARKIAARVAGNDSADTGGSALGRDRGEPARLPRPAENPRRGRVPRVAARRRHRRRLDRERRRRAVHRSEPAARRPRQHHPHRTARQRDAGVGARGGQPHPLDRPASSASPPDFLNTHDLHIHVPAGAIPKDGPSAGVTMATAIVSALKNQTVKRGRRDDRRDHA